MFATGNGSAPHGDLTRSVLVSVFARRGSLFCSARVSVFARRGSLTPPEPLTAGLPSSSDLIEATDLLCLETCGRRGCGVRDPRTTERTRAQQNEPAHNRTVPRTPERSRAHQNGPAHNRTDPRTTERSRARSNSPALLAPNQLAPARRSRPPSGDLVRSTICEAYLACGPDTESRCAGGTDCARCN